jgi:hypothetical protein
MTGRQISNLEEVKKSRTLIIFDASSSMSHVWKSFSDSVEATLDVVKKVMEKRNIES